MSGRRPSWFSRVLGRSNKQRPGFETEPDPFEQVFAIFSASVGEKFSVTVERANIGGQDESKPVVIRAYQKVWDDTTNAQRRVEDQGNFLLGNQSKNWDPASYTVTFDDLQLQTKGLFYIDAYFTDAAGRSVEAEIAKIDVRET